MNRTEKTQAIEFLKDKFENNQFFYVTDTSALTVIDIDVLRRKCFESDIEMNVVKNTLAIKALEAADESKGYAELMEAFKGPTTIMFSGNAKAAAQVISEYRKTHEKPILKAAYIDSDIFIGDDQLETLKSLKSKEDLIGDIVILLQSPIKKVLGQLQSGGQTIAGLVKTLQDRAE